MKLQVKRVYEAPGKTDGFRLLVDRLWPRGLTKEQARVDLWLREIGPSNELRQWCSHDPAKWDEFRRRYAEELVDRPELVEQVRQQARQGPVTLVYGAKDEAHNQAVALKQFLEGKRIR